MRICCIYFSRPGRTPASGYYTPSLRRAARCVFVHTLCALFSIGWLIDAAALLFFVCSSAWLAV